MQDQEGMFSFKELCYGCEENAVLYGGAGISAHEGALADA